MPEHDIVCDKGYVHWTCTCDGPHTTRTITCKIVHKKENQMDQPTVTPEDVAATAVDEADVVADLPEDTGYDFSGFGLSAPDDGEDHRDDAADPVEPNALTAFLVVVGKDGMAFATSELHKIIEIAPEREANLPDMRNACQQVAYDVLAMQTSQQTVALMQVSAKQMAEDQRAQKMAQALANKGIQVPRGGRR